MKIQNKSMGWLRQPVASADRELRVKTKIIVTIPLLLYKAAANAIILAITI